MNAVRTFKQRLIELAILAVIILLLVAAVVASGIMPVKASSGHWAITHATLQFASKRSIQTNSLGITVPPLDEPEMVRLGAATYASNCAWCHGSPLEEYPAVPAAMTPRPPSLTDSGEKWEPRELFYIAKHGIMLTGMPAWPTQLRDDEVWPMVVFLQKLGELDAEKYAALLYSTTPPESSSRKDPATPVWMSSCLDCHGREGQSVAGPRVPELQNLSGEYIAMTLRALKEGERPSGIMQPIAARLRTEQVDEIAEYFGANSQRTSITPAAADSRSDLRSEENVASKEEDTKESDVAVDITDSVITSGLETAVPVSDELKAGMDLIQNGNQERKIAACIECHGSRRSIASYPSLIGQSPEYIRAQLQLYANGSRRGGEAALMHDIAEKLDEKTMMLVSLAFSRLQEEP